MSGRWFDLIEDVLVDGKYWNEVYIEAPPEFADVDLVRAETDDQGRPVAVTVEGPRRVLGRVLSWGMGAELIRRRMLELLERRRSSDRRTKTKPSGRSASSPAKSRRGRTS